jgi:transposase
VLEYVPGRFNVVRHVRPKLACKRCDAISQAPAPSLPVLRPSRPRPAGAVVVSKFADHLPFHRQAQIFAREGVEISRSTLAGWMGQISWLLQPLVDRIAEHVMASPKLHADAAPVPVLSPGTPSIVLTSCCLGIGSLQCPRRPTLRENRTGSSRPMPAI